VHRVVYEEPEPLSSLVPGLPQDVERVLARALAKDPDNRYSTAEAFAEDAEDLVAGVPPRHAAGADLVAVDDLAALAAAPVSPPAIAAPVPSTAAPGELPAESGDTHTALPPPKRRRSRTPVAVAAAAVIGLVALFLSVPRSPNPERKAAAGQSPTNAPASAPPLPSVATTQEPARLRIDFDHPLRRGRLKVFVDDEQTLDEPLMGQQKKAALVFKVHEGSLREELEVAPGLHEVRIEVTWDDNKKVERIVGSFRSGATRRLDASLGRMRRELTLEWH
jgi:hypothetical protein